MWTSWFTMFSFETWSQSCTATSICYNTCNVFVDFFSSHIFCHWRFLTHKVKISSFLQTLEDFLKIWNRRVTIWVLSVCACHCQPFWLRECIDLCCNGVQTSSECSLLRYDHKVTQRPTCALTSVLWISAKSIFCHWSFIKNSMGKKSCLALTIPIVEWAVTPLIMSSQTHLKRGFMMQVSQFLATWTSWFTLMDFKYLVNVQFWDTITKLYTYHHMCFDTCRKF